MKRTIGASTISCLIALAGLTSVGVAGFTGMTPSVCGMLSLGCDGAKDSKVVQASAKEAGQCSKAAGTCSKTEQVAAAANAECAKACPFETLKVTQAAFDAAVASGCEKSKTEAHVALIQAKLAAANTELAKAEEVGCAKSKTEAEAKIAAIHAEAKEAGLCEKACFGEAAVQNAASAETPAQCTKGKAAKTPASALGRETPAVVGASSPFVIPAAFAPKASGGCCKAKGERAEVEAAEAVVTR